MKNTNYDRNDVRTPAQKAACSRRLNRAAAARRELAKVGEASMQRALAALATSGK